MLEIKERLGNLITRQLLMAFDGGGWYANALSISSISLIQALTRRSQAA
jgi:hypothetical protein